LGRLGARHVALEKLRELRVPGAIEKARQFLREDEAHFVRLEAAKLLSELGSVDTLLDIGEAFARERLNDHAFKGLLSTYLKRFPQISVSAVIAEMENAGARDLAETVLKEAGTG
jgi:hypothetical protein